MLYATLNALWAAYEAGSQEYFDYYREGASVFSLSSPIRITARDYRQTFGRQIGLQLRAQHILDPEVQLLGDCALVTCHSRVRVNYSSVDSRATVFLVQEGDGFKVAHLHLSPLSSPPATADTRGLVEEVTALLEDARPS